jgi:hypothetical protein
MAKSTITSKDIIELLIKRHPLPEHASFAEMRAGSGYSKAAQKRIDFWVLNCYPSKKHLTISYEIKVYRTDFLNELKDPKKRQQGLNFSNEFYFIAPKGVIKIEEVPKECGYIEVIENHTLKVIKEAPFRNCKDPTWLFVSSLARRAVKSEGVDFKCFSDELLININSLFTENNSLNGSETIFKDFIQNEMLNRRKKRYSKLKSERKKIRKNKKHQGDL